MKRPDSILQTENMSVSDRLRYWADSGVEVRGYGPIEEHAFRFGRRLLREGRLSFRDPNELRDNTHALHCLGRWAEFGFNVFDLSADLAAAFLLTDPAPTEGELKLPFPAFFIRLPPGIVPVFIHGQQHWAEGIWCHRFVADHQKEGDNVHFFRWSIEWKSVSLWTDRSPFTLDEAAEGTYQQIWDDDPPFVPEDAISMDRALRIIKNLISWLDATGGLTKHTKPQPPHIKRKASKERQRELKEGSWPHVWMFGRDVKLRPELRRMAQEFALSQSEKHKRPGWKLRSRLVVRGHWKWQPYGEGNQQRKRLFVQPYWRGPEGAAAWAHIYDADAPQAAVSGTAVTPNHVDAVSAFAILHRDEFAEFCKKGESK